MRSWHLLCVLTVLCGTLLFAGGCASRQPEPSSVDYRGIERPARPIDEEEPLTDRIGQVGVVILAVAVAGALIALPLIFLLG